MKRGRAEEPEHGEAPPSDRALVSKVHVVDGASLRFSESGSAQARDDTFDLEWEVTPMPAERMDLRAPRPAPNPAPPPKPAAPPPQPAAPPRAAPAPAKPAPAPKPAPRAPEAPRVEVEEALEAMPAMFAALRLVDLQAALQHFYVLDLAAGETLIGQGERHPALVLVLRGQIEASRGSSRRRVGTGEALGLTTLFGTGVWPTTLRTATPCRLLVLEVDGYRALRTAGALVALALEEHALQVFTDLQKRTADRIAELVPARPLEELVPRAGGLARLAASVGLGGVSSARIDPIPALLASPPFRNAEEHHLAGLASRLRPVRAPRGVHLVTQGEDGSSLYVLVEGAVDVITARGGRRGVLLEALRGGDLLGGWSAVRRSPDFASYVTSEPSVLLELDRVAWAELATARDTTGSVLRLALLRSLAKRLHHAAARVALLEGGAPEPDSDDARFVTILPTTRR